MHLLTLPGYRASSVDPSILPHIGGAEKLYYMFYFWGYTSAFIVYAGLSHFFPAPETIIPATIYEDSDVISAGSFQEGKAEFDMSDEKKAVAVESSVV
jgi:NCS1 family nucleobase:cation symporter-1